MKNAQIESTSLGYEHGILTAMLMLDYGDSGHQGFGGFVLGGSYTTKYIKGILDTVGVKKWESLAGEYVRVELSDGKNPVIKRIYNLLEDKCFDPSKL